MFHVRPLHRWLLAAALGLAAGTALGDDGRGRDGDRAADHSEHDDRELDYEDAERAVRRGEAKPLAEIVAGAAPHLGGEIVGIELERSHGRFVYEFKVVTPSGQLVEVLVDALTAELLGRERD